MSAFATLRSLVSKPQVRERCELCSVGVGQEHPHLVDPATRRLICACDACSLLFFEPPVPRHDVPSRDHRERLTGDARSDAPPLPLVAVRYEAGVDRDARVSNRFKRVPRDVRYLRDFQLTDGHWDSLMIPIGLAFFVESSVDARVMAMYPSPAGPTESLLPLETWMDIVQENPVLEQMQPDVEALLANRLGHGGEYFLTPIDKCYELVGLIRGNWRGLSGGTEVWQRIAVFFNALKESARA